MWQERGLEEMIEKIKQRQRMRTARRLWDASQASSATVDEKLDCITNRAQPYVPYVRTRMRALRQQKAASETPMQALGRGLFAIFVVGSSIAFLVALFFT